MLDPIIFKAKPLKERWEISNRNIDEHHLPNEFTKLTVYPFTFQAKNNFLVCLAEHANTLIAFDEEGNPRIVEGKCKIIALNKEILIENLKFYNVIED